MNGVVICVCCWGLWVLEILEQCVEVDEAAVTVAYGDGRDDSLIDKALDQPGVDGVFGSSWWSSATAWVIYLILTCFILRAFLSSCVYLQLCSTN